MFEKAIIVTRKTRLAELIERFNTRAQAKFYIEHAGSDFGEFEEEHETYIQALDSVQKQVREYLKLQLTPRELLPSCLITQNDLIITLGQDGLVANTAKYVGCQPIVAVNPDPKRFDGILLPISVGGCATAVEQTIRDAAKYSQVSLARITLNDGQSLLAFNDIFIGPVSHTSLRYRLHFNGKSEHQSSSGIIVATGAGSTGWMSSIFRMVEGVCSSFGGKGIPQRQLPWDGNELLFVVREPFASRHSSSEIVAGMISSSSPLVIESRVPSGGVIFSDGMERDFLAFNSGASAQVTLAEHKARLVKLS